MSGVATDIKILDQILKIIHPHIYTKLKELNVDLSIFVLEWMVCLYTTALPFYVIFFVYLVVGYCMGFGAYLGVECFD